MNEHMQSPRVRWTQYVEAVRSENGKGSSAISFYIPNFPFPSAVGSGTKAGTRSESGTKARRHPA